MGQSRLQFRRSGTGLDGSLCPLIQRRLGQHYVHWAGRRRRRPTGSFLFFYYFSHFISNGLTFFFFKFELLIIFSAHRELQRMALDLLHLVSAAGRFLRAQHVRRCRRREFSPLP